MKNSSASQLAFEYAESSSPASQSAANSSSDSVTAINVSSEPLKVPNFARYDEVYAATSRIAGRINAASISAAEHESLLKERQALLDLKLSGNMTRRESNRLEYIRWSLDRIEDAKFGPALDHLENAVARYEQFLSDIGSLHSDLSQRTPGKQKK